MQWIIKLPGRSLKLAVTFEKCNKNNKDHDLQKNFEQETRLEQVEQEKVKLHKRFSLRE